MDIDWQDPKSLALIALDSITLLVLAALFFRLLWNWKVYRRAGSSYLSSIAKWCSNLAFTSSAEVQVLEKFHKTLVKVKRTGNKFMAAALFLRLLAIQPALFLNEEHTLQPSLDVSNLISYPVCLLIAVCPEVVQVNTLNPWYFVMQTLCVFPLAITEPDAVIYVSLITVFPRMLCGIAAKSCFLAILGNVVNAFLAWHFCMQDHGGMASGGSFIHFAELCMVISGICSVRWGLYEIILMNGKLNSRSIDLSAVSQLLLGVCDAVIEIDSSLRLTEDSRQLSALLLHNQGMTSEGLAGKDFLSFFAKEDRGHIEESFSETAGNMPRALHARMLDCLGSNLQIELQHCHFENAQGHRCYLVGMREFQDMSHHSIAPLPFESPLSKDSSLLFNPESMEILHAQNFERWSSQNLQGTNLMDLPTGGNLSEILTAIQEAVNDLFESGRDAYGPMDFENMELFSTRMTVRLKLQQDLMLNALVGTLNLEPRSALTQQNLAKLTRAEAKKVKKKRRSRSSKGSSERTSQSSGGSILSLHAPFPL